MGRRIKLRDDNEFSNESRILPTKDDRKKAEQVTTPHQFDMFLDRNGAVARAIEGEGGYQHQIIEYRADGIRTVNKENVQKAVLNLRDEITNSRFESAEYINQLRDSTVIKDESGRGLTSKQKDNLITREYQVRAIGLLTAIRVGDIKVSPYDKGILNRLADGKYTEVVYGKADSRGQRQFEKGTFRNKAGFGRGSIQSSTAEGRARAKELADNLREANQGQSGRYAPGRFTTSLYSGSRAS